MLMILRWTCLVPAALVLALGLGLPAPVAGGETGPLRMIVPLAPGATADVVARILGQRFAQALERPVVIENIPSAGGVPGTAQLARAPADGSVLGMVASNHVINPALYKHMPFDPLADFTPLSVVGSFPLVLVAIPALPVNNAQELIALARARPGQLNYGSGGNGSILHLAVELLRAEAGGLAVQHVPYNGSAQMTADLLRGQIQFGFLSVTVAAPLIKSGKLRALGLSTRARSAFLPELPTLAEQGLPHYHFDAWIALIAPPGMAPALVERYHGLTVQALRTPEVKDALGRQGLTVIGGSPREAAAHFRSELAKHARLVRQSGAFQE